MNKRRYGDGLDKFEPNDLNHALAPSPEWFEALPESLIERALEYCREYDRLPAEMEDAFSTLIGESGDYLQREALMLS